MPGDDTERIERLEQRVTELEQQVEHTPSLETVKWLVAQVQGSEGFRPDPEAMTTLERYAQMPLEKRVSTLPASEMRATLLLENWTSWAQRGAYGTESITSRQERPATIRVLLRERDPTVDVEAGENLAWNQVYRAMRAAHRLTDGALEYDERATTSSPTDHRTFHALLLQEPGRMPTLPR